MVARAAGHTSFKGTFAARFLQLVCSSQVTLSEGFLNLIFLSHARNIDVSRNWAIMVARAAGHNSFKGTFAARFLQLVCSLMSSSQVILSEGVLNLSFLSHGSRNWAIMVARAAGHYSFKGTSQQVFTADLLIKWAPPMLVSAFFLFEEPYDFVWLLISRSRCST